VRANSIVTITVLGALLLPHAGWGGGEQVVQSLLSSFEQFAAHSSNRFMLLFCIAAATLISEDLACIAAGLFAAGGIISPLEAVVAAGLGIYIGDIMLYLTGYLIGVTALHRAPLKWLVSEQTVHQCRDLFERRGIPIIFVSRFVPGTRTATFLGAGLVRVDMARLLVVFACAVMLWTPLLVLGAMVVGNQVVHVAELYTAWGLWIFLALLGLLLLVTRVLPRLFTRRGRRLLVGWWRRLVHWEFWPYYVVNVVTFVYVLCTGVIKYRRPTLFTVTNPAIRPDSGFLGESKADILRGLNPELVGRWRLVSGSVSGSVSCSVNAARHDAIHKPADPAARMDLLEGFMAEHGLSYPVVLKPDRGQRGQGVEICSAGVQAAAWLETVTGDYLMMEYLPGMEFGLFYYRMPDDERGKIFSVNRKKLLSVTGDGSRTLEELILADERAVCMAPVFFKTLSAELLDIVPAGHAKQLGTVGTHCRGAVFLDGSDLITPELLEAVERAVESYDGFYFGRFDIKAPDEYDFSRGRNLKIIELNGLTSEAAHIYDPKNSILYAWRVLIEQWSLAFRIAAQNQARGFEPMSLGGFVRHWYRAGTGRLESSGS